MAASQYNKDKLLGMFAGVALGDALGLPYEFARTTPKIAYSRIVNQIPFDIQFQFMVTHVEAASVSDDTLMTLALLRCIIENKKYNRSAVILAYEKFAASSNMLGRNTRRLFKGVKTVNGYEKRFAAMTNEEKAAAQSNGCLMRATPLVLVGDQELHTDVYLTNPNETSYECVKIFVAICRMLLTGDIDVKDKVKEYCRGVVTADINVRQCLTDAVDMRARKIDGKTKGWVCHALYIALYAFFKYNALEDAVDYVIRENPGSDCDTTASITCALFGAHLGYSGMLAEQITAANLVIMNKHVVEIDELISAI